MLSTIFTGVRLVGQRRGKDSKLDPISSKISIPVPNADVAAGHKKRSDAKSTGESAGFGRILSLYGNSGSNERRNSMQELIDESVDFLNTVRKNGFPPEVHSLLETSMVDVTNRSYTVLESIALELNEALGPSELWLSCTPPQFVSETLKFDRMRRPVDTVTTFRARISSNFYSIVLRAVGGRVEFLLVPSDRAVGLTKIEADYQPLMSFVGHLGKDCVEWQVEDKPLTNTRLEKYCIEFFKYFLEETRQHIFKPPVAKTQST
jgi:hypothetical protein